MKIIKHARIITRKTNIFTNHRNSELKLLPVIEILKLMKLKRAKKMPSIKHFVLSVYPLVQKIKIKIKIEKQKKGKRKANKY